MMRAFCIVTAVVLIFLFPAKVDATTITEFYEYYNETLSQSYISSEQMEALTSQVPEVDLTEVNKLIEELTSESDDLDREIKDIETFNAIISLSGFGQENEENSFDLYQEIQKQEQFLKELEEVDPYSLNKIDAIIKGLTYQINKETKPQEEIKKIDSEDKVEMFIKAQESIWSAYMEKDEVIKEAEAKELERQEMLAKLALDNQLTPYSLPLSKYNLFENPESFRISSTMSPRIHPIKGTFEVHSGVDFAGPGGSNILFPFNKGVVLQVGYDGSRGNYVVVYVEPNITVHFFHLQREAIWRVGDLIKLNDVIGLVGTTGSSTGNHLHLTLKVNNNLKSVIG